MGCRCSKPELDAFEREERLILEHAAMAEKIKVHIRIAVSSHWEKDSKVEEVTFEDHCEVYQSIVESQRSVRWKQYLTKRTLDIITNNACRRGMLDMETEKAIKSETLRLVDDHISTLENKQANEHVNCHANVHVPALLDSIYPCSNRCLCPCYSFGIFFRVKKKWYSEFLHSMSS